MKPKTYQEYFPFVDFYRSDGRVESYMAVGRNGESVLLVVPSGYPAGRNQFYQYCQKCQRGKTKARLARDARNKNKPDTRREKP